MISGYTALDLYEEASFIFRKRLLVKVEPNYVTIASILRICPRIVDLRHEKEFQSYILKCPVVNDYLIIWNALVRMYARSGKLPEARKLFDSMSTKDEVTYTSLIAAYGMQGDRQTVLKLFKEMHRRKIKLDLVTMVVVLSACSHSGLVTEGEMLFREMSSFYNFVPRLEHYACTVDLFGRAGMLNRAKETMLIMPYSLTPAIWNTLLRTCQNHVNADIREWARTHLLDMKLKNSGSYVSSANMYANDGSWNKLAKVRTFMKNVGVRKSPGCAWVDLGSGFRRFFVGGCSEEHGNELSTVGWDDSAVMHQNMLARR